MRVLIQLRPDPDVVASVIDPGVVSHVADVVGDLPGVLIDRAFAPVALPRPRSPRGGGLLSSLASLLDFSLTPDDATVLIRGEISDDDVPAQLSALSSAVREVTGVFADPPIHHHVTCGDSGPVGDWHDVERLLGVRELHEAGYDGEGVHLAIVDGGIDKEHVAAKLGREVRVDAGRSWTPPGANGSPGAWPTGHGSMCAFDAQIAARASTLLDVAVLRSSKGTIGGVLSDALAAYSHLRTVLTGMPERSRALVISNSWGLFRDDQDDFRPGQPGNFTDNPRHPFNVMVASLERAGADILFSAGNCGRDCPDRRCGVDDIIGANGHPQVITVAGVDVHGERVGYSSQGPARLADNKPDISAYTHFLGSEATGAGQADTGTSASCPIAAGVVAALRTRHSAARLSPAQLRTLLHRTAEDRSTVGFDHDYGYGIVNAPALVAALRKHDERAA
ncbi:S8 family serine peptidase [Nonomuraea sp. NN258]|uniref:S8 family peptidase n=1 Tax=Nonomuraea antri TaxID=2730852 RepID=UPI00156A60FE|nr:S8 family serine peptidase [Nonomuraea antri]NRQ39457.1 S8 family serine peptidase [Nonomuraea antri]